MLDETTPVEPVVGTRWIGRGTKGHGQTEVEITKVNERTVYAVFIAGASKAQRNKPFHLGKPAFLHYYSPKNVATARPPKTVEEAVDQTLGRTPPAPTWAPPGPSEAALAEPPPAEAPGPAPRGLAALSDEQRAEVVALYGDHTIPTKALADAYHINISELYRLLRQEGVPPGRTGGSEAQVTKPSRDLNGPVKITRISRDVFERPTPGPSLLPPTVRPPARVEAPAGASHGPSPIARPAPEPRKEEPPMPHAPGRYFRVTLERVARQTAVVDLYDARDIPAAYGRIQELLADPGWRPVWTGDAGGGEVVVTGITMQEEP